jgi:hypothetical protein
MRALCKLLQRSAGRKVDLDHAVLADTPKQADRGRVTRELKVEGPQVSETLRLPGQAKLRRIGERAEDLQLAFLINLN